MKRKPIILGLFAILFYLLLLSLLVLAESGAPGATITSFGSAAWYSLTTLTTVGYGDTYPVTAAGRIIGVLFQLMSLGVVVALIGALFSLLRSRYLPLLSLTFLRRKHWFIFSESNPASEKLAECLSREEKDSVILFTDVDHSRALGSYGMSASLSPAELLAFKKGKGTCDVFAMSADYSENDRLAEALKDAPCRVFAMTDYEADRLSDSLILFNPYEVCARLYWRRYPVSSPTESIVLVGDGLYAEALLEQALMYNVLDPDQCLTYSLIGDFDNFRRNHPYLGQVSDKLIFRGPLWNEDLALYKNADRIIFCRSSVEQSLEEVTELKRYCPLTAPVYVRGAAPLEGIVSFGTLDDIFTPDLTMHLSLSKTAEALHDIYMESARGAVSWADLNGFLRRSNLASADHILMKIRILLGETGPASSLTREKVREAVSVYKNADAAALDRCRRIEHLRWMRFHLMNNWQYAPSRDNKNRLHPLMLPYDELSPDSQKKDSYAWELLEKLLEKEII